MFITKKKSDELRREAWSEAWDIATENYVAALHQAADRVALEASRGAPQELQYREYIKTYDKVYKHLANEHAPSARRASG